MRDDMFFMPVHNEIPTQRYQEHTFVALIPGHERVVLQILHFAFGTSVSRQQTFRKAFFPQLNTILT